MVSQKSISFSGVVAVDISFAAGTKVPAQETTYMCQAFDLPQVVVSTPHHMVAVRPNIVNMNVAHHILVYGCNKDGNFHFRNK